MKGHRKFEFPPEQEAQRQRARRLAWWSIGLLVTAATMLALALGQSEAMKTAWVTDIMSMIPPIAVLVALRFELRGPTDRFPYGHFRAVSIAFLVTASTLTVIGLWLFVDAASKLLKHERPPIGTMVILGHQFWAGWAMIAALAYSMFLGMVLGKLKKPVAEALHAKVIESEAQMNRDEWMSEGAAIVGLPFVAFGRWWGDAAAAAIIALQVIRDGWINVRSVVGDLMDESPTKLGSVELEDLPRRVKETVERLDWVERATVRLREQGHVVTGDVFVVPRDASVSVARMDDAVEQVQAMDWRLHGITLTPTARLDD